MAIAEAVSSHIYRIISPLPFPPVTVNLYLLQHRDGFALVDCGLNSRDAWDVLEQGLAELGIKPADLTHLLLTHVHPDHMGAAGRLKEASGAPVFVHRLEEPFIASRYRAVAPLLAEVEVWLRHHGASPAEAEALSKVSLQMLNSVQPTEVDIVLEGDETLEIGGIELRTFWTPGHSPGHLCYYDTRQRILLAGDHLLPGTTPNISQHPQSSPSPLDDFYAALHAVEQVDVALTLPGHGDPIHDHRARIAEMLAHHERRKNQMIDLLTTGPLSGWDISKTIYKRVQGEPFQQRLALMETLAHLQALAHAGRIRKLMGDDGAVLWERAAS
ncbi:MAG TPA: MBL fold metallo-hydrolase [Ktedonobacterales bacterium]|jgi:glyoxylase-like metal-dependent hydrolase (beta-lactamase superfamily II)